MKKVRIDRYRILVAMLFAALLMSPTYMESSPQRNSKKTNVEQKGRSAKKTRSTDRKKSVGSKKRSSGKKTSQTKERSADEIRKQQRQTEREITDTKRQISENTKAIESNLSELREIGADIDVAQKQISEIGSQVNSLKSRISGLEKNIGQNEAELSRMRESYLRAIKKMRLGYKNNSAMAFVFSSGSFNEAMRRIRYMKKFSAWRKRQSDLIGMKVAELQKDREKLSAAHNEKNKALNKEVRLREDLRLRQRQKDELVVKLRADGSALQAHLSKKQAEANALRGQIAAIIAREEARRQEEARRKEEARLEAERKRQQELERQERLEAENARIKKEKERSIAAEKESAAKNKKTKDKQKSKSGKKEDKEKVGKQKSSGKDYAQARKRRSRVKTSADNSTPAKSSLPASSKGGFENAKGSLPRPSSSGFKIISPFGRHSVPGLSDVIYDNPGIDAETSSGASAVAVYPGVVSGIYVLPGYSNVVIINHDGYYTVYGNIASPTVRNGEKVRQGQSLGRLAADEDSGVTKIHFEVWKNRNKLNPTEWIR